MCIAVRLLNAEHAGTPVAQEDQAAERLRFHRQRTTTPGPAGVEIREEADGAVEVGSRRQMTVPHLVDHP